MRLGAITAGDFYEAERHALPFADDSVDLVLCAIALSHVPDLEPVLTESVVCFGLRVIS